MMLARAVVLLVLAGTALVVPAAPAVAAACAQDKGVTLVVEFNALGGGTQTRCADGNPSSGVNALRAAGFTPTRAAQQAGYFLCRIDGKPANDPCQRTSPADAYWSYWHAKPGGSWTYSDTGPAEYDPAPDSVEGWAFGAGKPPRSAPPRPAAEAGSPPPAASPSPLVSVRPTARASTAVAPAPAKTFAPSPRATATAETADVASSTPAPNTTPTGSPDPSPREVAGAVQVQERARGIGAGAVGGLLLLVALSVAGAWQWRSRRLDGR